MASSAFKKELAEFLVGDASNVSKSEAEFHEAEKVEGFFGLELYAMADEAKGFGDGIFDVGTGFLFEVCTHGFFCTNEFGSCLRDGMKNVVFAHPNAIDILDDDDIPNELFKIT